MRNIEKQGSQIKPIDLQILSFMRDNARTNLTTISKKTGIPVSTVFDRLKIMRKLLAIRPTMIVDFKRLGYTLRSTILLRTDQAHREQLQKYLLANERVNNLYRVNNGYDFALDCVFTGMQEAEEFLERLEKRFRIVDKHLLHVVEDLARERFMSCAAKNAPELTVQKRLTRF